MPKRMRKAREEHDRRGDRLGTIADVLADERLCIADTIGEQDGLSILGIAQAEIRAGRMNRHREETELYTSP